jgi:hypothetical protein
MLMNGVRGGHKVTLSGKVTNAAGMAVSGKKVTVAIDNVSVKSKTTDKGVFTVQLTLPSTLALGQYRVTAKTGTGEGTTWISVTGGTK